MRKLNLNQVNGNGCGFITILNLAQFPVIFSNLILAPPVISLDDLSASVLTEIVKIFQPKFNDDVFSLIRMKTIFPFVKGTEYEMSLETMDELLIVKLVSKSEKEPTEDRVKERWSSIDEVANNEPAAKKAINIAIDPPLESFAKEIHQFLGYNKNYGDGWLTALKVKIVGNWTNEKASLQLVDLGLVPGNYCEA